LVFDLIESLKTIPLKKVIVKDVHENRNSKVIPSIKSFKYFGGYLVVPYTMAIKRFQ
jgi:hypothetical protein